MALPLALMATGTALQVFGQYQANYNQAKAEMLNAKFYDDQAQYAQEASFREANIASKRYEMTRGAQIGGYAKGGVDISGSAAGVVAGTLADKITELHAIQRKGDMEYTLANLRARQSRGQADMLTSFEYNALQMSGTVLGNMARSGIDFSSESGSAEPTNFKKRTDQSSPPSVVTRDNGTKSTYIGGGWIPMSAPGNYYWSNKE